MPDGTLDNPSDRPGPDGTPVPVGSSVLRLGPEPSPKNANDPGHALLEAGKAWPGLFVFSTKERELEASGVRPRLSVWLKSHTTLAQAWVLVGCNPNNRIAITLDTDRIRAISATANQDSPATPHLDVVWEQACSPHPTENDLTVPDKRPGAAGHCGIENLCCGNKAQRNHLRQRLADAVQPGQLVVLTDREVDNFHRMSSEEAR